MAESLFDKYGGFDTFTLVVSSFYQKVLDSDELEHYFRNVNMDNLMAHQTNFIAKALGGPDAYEGRDLRQAHINLDISLPDFLEVAELLEESLEEAGVEDVDVEAIIQLVGSLQDQIVMQT
ncbi:truncated hemoglobin [Shewanella psychrophila]|uniref:Truncated hemoglobin n=1 Tax=Shewanella psychrophila TaxID=225848 RepID=A0A1S6HUF8_9GAMM|nr:group 1 truncated hemoglobin [Shewanella psychrophila]AQS39196.1 truncated hemoglobin [Shewanella psychrophila]